METRQLYIYTVATGRYHIPSGKSAFPYHRSPHDCMQDRKRNTGNIRLLTEVGLPPNRSTHLRASSTCQNWSPYNAGRRVCAILAFVYVLQQLHCKFVRSLSGVTVVALRTVVQAECRGVGSCGTELRYIASFHAVTSFRAGGYRCTGVVWAVATRETIEAFRLAHLFIM